MRRLFLGFVCLPALAALAVASNAAHAQIVAPTPPCHSIVGTTVNCSGNLASGIAAGDPFTVLNVNALDRNIAPATGVNGINFSSSGPLTINADTGQFSILSNGFVTSGIYALGSGAVEVNFSGRIITCFSAFGSGVVR